MRKFYILLSVIIIFGVNTTAKSIESIYTAPDVFVTSKIKPSVDFEGDRGNILFQSHDIEKKKNQYSVGGMLNDLPGMSSSSLGSASRPIVRGMSNSRVKILQNSSSLSDVSEFGEDHIVGKIEVFKVTAQSFVTPTFVFFLRPVTQSNFVGCYVYCWDEISIVEIL